MIVRANVVSGTRDRDADPDADANADRRRS